MPLRVICTALAHGRVQCTAAGRVRILYRCWQTRTPYDESTYLNALKKRGSPLLNQLGMQT